MVGVMMPRGGGRAERRRTPAAAEAAATVAVGAGAGTDIVFRGGVQSKNENGVHNRSSNPIAYGVTAGNPSPQEAAAQRGWTYRK